MYVCFFWFRFRSLGLVLVVGDRLIWATCGGGGVMPCGGGG